MWDFIIGCHIILVDQKDSQITTDADSNSTKKSYNIRHTGDLVSYCVGMVVLVKPSVKLDIVSKSRYSQIFLNSISKILTNFGANVIKTRDDMVLYYFPQSVKLHRRFGFMSCLESSLTLEDERDSISLLSKKAVLPPINYKISADYGEVAVMSSSFSSNPDLIGPTVNICAKINPMAPLNKVVIGSDLYEIVKKFGDYRFGNLGQYSIGLKNSYSTYSLKYH